METPDELLYSDDHEWVRLEGDEAVIGISAFAVERLGDIVFVELPEAGAEFAAGDSFGVVESAKAAADLYAPVGGEVIESNTEELETSPETVNADPYGRGWMVRVRVADASETGRLKDAPAYREMIAEEE